MIKMENKQTYEYQSVFTKDIKNLLYEKKQFLREETLRRYNENLKIFDLWCIENNIKTAELTKELVTKWMTKRDTENSLTRQLRCSITRELARNMIKNKKNAYIIPKNYYKGVNEHIPYIFTDLEIIKILNYLDSIKNDPQYQYRKETYSLIFKLLIYTGARKSEILNLKVKNINFDKKIISIIDGKEYVDRNIPMSDELFQDLFNYYNLLLLYGNDESFFFSNIDIYKGIRKKVSKGSLKDIFRKALIECNIEYMGISKGPRIHDLRFTFVVKSIKKLIDEKKDLNVYLPILVKYLGHSDLGDTLYYFKPKYCIFDEKNYKNNNLIPKLKRSEFYDE